MAALTYILCAATALISAVLLLRGFKRTRVPLLFWSGLCFCFLAAENVLLFVDMQIVPDMDIRLLRDLPAVLGASLLVWGLINPSETRP